ncbi:hypothetical protein CONCODRAFT_73199 [Conidiobolus coronatus NRRL 28638]|uniref:Secreted protein n=1 Tax=Conidiobolus coronatus (strain ATCC 28846 / CBS 209.66 / NRRL 28638) TaxID=796925 RepID=A0A137NWT2_CONC2|nr:hypothetical protein CONCODRAFT_73199 [Conidiobolus coronatus NRRL 28638]|eukprot:KXN67158.1 hypothetical protein CONCODRAFT_73199 [Conidiobolus coronatus NRRL 28638]
MQLNPFSLFLALASTSAVFAQDTTDSKQNQCFDTKNNFTDHINGPECLCQNKQVVPILSNYFVNNFSQCYNSTSLYFSSMKSICSNACFAPTVIGSEYIQQYCPQTKNTAPDYQASSYGNSTSKIPSKNLVYRSWANMNISKLACSRYSANDTYCLEKLYRVQTHYSSSQVGIDVSNHTDEICDRCNKRFVKELDDPMLVPMVYIHQLVDPVGIFNFIKKTCF